MSTASPGVTRGETVLNEDTRPGSGEVAEQPPTKKIKIECEHGYPYTHKTFLPHARNIRKKCLESIW